MTTNELTQHIDTFAAQVKLQVGYRFPPFAYGGLT
jgi:hypothetical protein